MINGNGIRIIHTARFLKSFKRLPKSIQEKAFGRDIIFRKNPFDPRLDTHKLHGRFKDYWAYSVDYHCRVIFIFSEPKIVSYYDIGFHPIYGGG